MKAMVQARLDRETQAVLERLVKRHGWSMSRVVREGIRLIGQRQAAAVRPRLIGIGMFEGGPTDLSTNKKYLEDLGRKSMGRRKGLLRGAAK
jgi:hypothetical protein